MGLGNTYTGLYVLKLLCAIFVVLQHTGWYLSGKWSVPINIAVPCFYMVTGFFLQDSKKIPKSIMKVLKFAVKLQSIYLLWFILCKQFGLSMANKVQLDSIEFYCHLLLLGDTPGGHLWYLTSYMQAMFLLYVLAKFRVKFKYMVSLGTIGLLMNFLLGEFAWLYTESPLPYWLSRNFFTNSFPFIIFGMILRKCEDTITLRKSLIALLVSIFCLYIEELYIYKEGYGLMNMAVVPLSVATFSLFTKLNQNNRTWSFFASYGRDYSLSIYAWHILVLYILSEFLVYNRNFEAIIVIICTLLVSITFSKFKSSQFKLSKV